ncbi:MAG: imidazoleglycerol-phosphate dehydratase HisB [Lachnospiraceae bacterium]|jgi:imidazoleglycerol-phosphate dehydratase|nr:imidazoleglycerol-phosphate dehydratase HisB [Lachnospiraceae bacterium]
MRNAVISRNTGETQIRLELGLDGKGTADLCGGTGIGFFDHMLNAFARHGFFDLKIEEKGDLEVDGHHLVEDTGIVMGEAIRQAAGDKAGIRRFGYFVLPMDEALVLCAVDLCGRPYFAMDFENGREGFSSPMVGEFDTQLVREFFYSVSYGAMMNLHFKILSGENDHHIIEAMFKAFAKAMDIALQKDPRIEDVLSTKGCL